jgi:hypothetical protein
MMAFNDNKHKYIDEEAEEESTTTKRQQMNGDDDDDSLSSNDDISLEPELEEVSSKGEMNLHDSQEIKLFQRWACSDDGNTFESEYDSVKNTGVGSNDWLCLAIVYMS